MPSSRGCRSSYDCIVKIKGVTTRPILFSQLMRSDGEGAMNPEELFADDRSFASEQERVHEDELHSLMHSILDWAISFLSESSQGTIRAIYFEGKTVKQHSEEELAAGDGHRPGTRRLAGTCCIASWEWALQATLSLATIASPMNAMSRLKTCSASWSRSCAMARCARSTIPITLLM